MNTVSTLRELLNGATDDAGRAWSMLDAICSTDPSTDRLKARDAAYRVVTVIRSLPALLDRIEKLEAVREKAKMKGSLGIAIGHSDAIAYQLEQAEAGTPVTKPVTMKAIAAWLRKHAADLKAIETALESSDETEKKS